MNQKSREEIEGRYINADTIYGRKNIKVDNMKLFNILIILLPLIMSRVAYAEEPIIIAIGVKEDTRPFRMGVAVLNEISKKMGVAIQLKHFPNRRSTRLLSKSEIHAVLVKIPEFIKKVPTAIMVAEPIINLPYYVYTVLPDLKVIDWNSLKPYTIVSIRGVDIVNEFLKDHTVHDVGSVKSAFGFLKAKRADVFVINMISAESYLANPNFDASTIIKIDQPIMVVDEFTFFASKYPELAERFNQALIELKKEGLYQKLIAETK